MKCPCLFLVTLFLSSLLYLLLYNFRLVYICTVYLFQLFYFEPFCTIMFCFFNKYLKIKKKRAPSRKWKNNTCKKTFANHISWKVPVYRIYKKYNSISKKQIIQLKNRQKTWIDIFPKKTYRWPTGTRKDAQHC